MVFRCFHIKFMVLIRFLNFGFQRLQFKLQQLTKGPSRWNRSSRSSGFTGLRNRGTHRPGDNSPFHVPTPGIKPGLHWRETRMLSTESVVAFAQHLAIGFLLLHFLQLFQGNKTVVFFFQIPPCFGFINITFYKD